jgi:oligopeptide transport system substrate-binding protein
MGYPDEPLPAGSQLEPELAEDYPKVSSDRKTYTFTIRKDARFSDGKPVTAGAFLRAFERVFDPKMKAADAEFFEAIVGARKMLAGKETRLGGVVASGRVLRVRLTSPVPDLLARLSLLCAVPPALPADPEGAKAPLPSPAPYFPPFTSR